MSEQDRIGVVLFQFNEWTRKLLAYKARNVGPNDEDRPAGQMREVLGREAVDAFLKYRPEFEADREHLLKQAEKSYLFSNDGWCEFITKGVITSD